MVSNAGTSLAPGFRFHPTDEELVRFYLRRKICGKPFPLDVISEIDIYKTEPWDLPYKSKLKTRDLEWYFFSVLDKKYGNGARTNRATENGYWKTTGKDRAVFYRSQVVGMKKTLVYHFGRAPRGQRTNWVMHEYRLIDEALDKIQDAFVLCRIFQKSGPGPKNGEQYGAPLIEEEWEYDELESLPRPEGAAEMEVGEDAYLDENDLEQILGAEVQPENVPLQLEYFSGEGVVLGGSERNTESVDDSQKLLISLEDYTCEEEQQPNDHLQKHLVSSEGYNYVHEQLEDKATYDLSVDQVQVKHEYIGEPSGAFIREGTDDVNGEQYMDANNDFDLDPAAFFESDDLLNPLDVDTSALGMLEEYLAFSDANDGMSNYITFDPTMVGGSGDYISDDVPTSQDVKAEIKPIVSSELPVERQDDASSSKQMRTNYGTGYQHPFIKQASQMLMGSIPAPPAFASEFPMTKDAALHLKSGSHSSSPVHVTAGMIQIRNTSQAGHGSDMFHGEDGLCNFTVSFGMSRGDDNSTTLESVVRILPGKAVSGCFGGSFYLMLLSILVLSLSCKMGSLIFGH